MGMASLTKINIVYHYVYNCAREIYRSHVVVLVSLGHKEDDGDQEGEAFGGGSSRSSGGSYGGGGSSRSSGGRR